MSKDEIKGIHHRLTNVEKKIRSIQQHLEISEHDKDATGEHCNATVKDNLADTKPVLASQVRPTPQNPPSTKTCGYQPPPNWKLKLEAVGILFAIGYAIVTGVQWYDLRHNFTMDQRAWVINTEVLPGFRDSTGAPIWIRAGQRVVFGVKFSNSGKSPAIGVEARMTAKLFLKNEPFTAIYDPAETQPSSIVLSPQGSGQLDIDPRSALARDLTTDDVTLITSGDVILRGYGEINYKDIFKEPHQTTFCIYLARDLKTFKHCTEYNKAN